MKSIIHVDQHAIRRNLKEGRNDPVISVRTYKGTKKAHSVHVDGPLTFIYRPDKPLSCGARLWAETTANVTCSDAEQEKQV